MKLKKDDTVIIIAGKDKGKTGKIMRIFKKTNKIIVEKINMRKKHIKKTERRAGEIITYEAPLNASNAMLLDPKTNKPTRIGYKRLENGEKIRIAKKSGESIDFKKPTSKSK